MLHIGLELRYGYELLQLVIKSGRKGRKEEKAAEDI